MHPLNNQENVGKDFFFAPNAYHTLKLEVLYTKLFGVLPTGVHFNEEFSLDCISFIDQHFDSFATNVVFKGKYVHEEGYMLGKQDSEFAQMVLYISYRTSQGETLIPEYPVIGGIQEKNKNVASVKLSAAAKTKEQAQALNRELRSFGLVDSSNIYMLTNSYGELDLTAMPVEDLKPDLALNYGDEFLEVSDNIIKSLNEEKSGLYLFHGTPGTGKSSYIKHLCSGILSRKVVYIPIGLIGSLTSPDMLPLLMRYKDLILVIEDAEKALVSRDESGRSDLVSTILNLTDGFIGQSLNVTIVATFNTEKENIDAALLRKGRLKHCYEFKPLTQKQAARLAKSLGKSEDAVDSDMTLADVYYMEASTGYVAPEVKRVGFC